MKSWWTEVEAKVADAVFGLVDAIRKNSTAHHQDLLKAHRLYGNFESMGISAGTYSRANVGRSNFLTLNVVKSCVDTIFARIAKSIPRPVFLTDGGTWSQQKKARRLEKFVAGIFYQTKFARIARVIFRDSEIFGKGIVKIVEDAKKRIRIERVFPDEIVVDPMETVYGEPRQIYQIRVVSKDVLIGMFPGHKVEIEASTPSAFGQTDQLMIDSASLVHVIESWHLPSTVPPDVKVDATDPTYAAALMEGHDGRHSICINGKTLLFEAWRDDYFPFSFLDWSPPVLGFWPKGLPIELRGIQYEINRILRNIQDSVDFCVPKMLVHNSANVVLSHLDDIIGGIIKWGGEHPPTLQAWAAIPQQLLEHVDRLVRQAYEISGVSQLSAASKKPSGLESGAALREYDDIQSERFAIPGVGLEEFVVDVSVQVIRLAKKIADRDGDYAVNAPQRKRTMLKIKWSEIDLDEADFVTEIFPASALPRDPAGRLAMVQDFINLNLLDKEDVPRLLNFPDLEAVNELNEASAEFTNMQMEAMIDRSEAQSPEPYQNLVYAKKFAQSSLLAAATQKVPEANLQLVREYINECVVMIAATQPTPPSLTAGAGQGAPPPGSPAPGPMPQPMPAPPQ